MSQNKIWFYESYFKHSPIIYSFIAILIGIIIIFTYWISSFFVKYCPWDIYTIIPAFTNGFYVTIVLIGIPYFLIKGKRIFIQILNNKEQETNYTLYEQFNAFLEDKKVNSLILLMVFIPVLILTYYRIDSNVMFYQHQNTLSALLLDIFNMGLTYFSLYLLVMLLWMLIAIFWTYNNLDKEPFWHDIEVDLLSLDGVAGLKPLQSFLRGFVSFYFIVLTFFILSFISPSTMLQKEGLFVLILLVVGLILTFFGFSTLNNLIKRKAQLFIETINQKIKEQSQKLINLSEYDTDTDNQKELEKIRMLLEAYHNERERMVSIIKKNRVIDTKMLIEPGIPFCLSIIAFVLDIRKFMV